jgi:hypothetical protein
MALIREDLQGRVSRTHTLRADGSLITCETGVFDGIVETASDLELPRVTEFAPGSILYCLANHKLYIKKSDAQWEEITT